MVKMSAIKNLPNGCNVVSKQIFDKVEENQFFWMFSVVYGLIKESFVCKRFLDVFSKHSFNLVVFLWFALTVTLAIVACLPDVKVLFYIQVVRTLFSFFIPSMICFCASALAGIVMKKRNLQYFTHICFASCVIFEAFFEMLNQIGLNLFSSSLITHGFISCLFISLAGTICVHKKFHVTLYIMAAVVLFRFTLSSFKSFQNTPPIFLYIFFLSGLFMSNLASLQISEVVSEDLPEKIMAIPVMRQRRASSLDVRYTNKPGFVLPLNRRKSLPALGLEGRKGSSGSVDFSTLGEAHGMLTDLLADSSLPINVTGTLRIIVDMLSPLLQGQFNAQNYPNSLEKQKTKEDEQQVLNQPDFKEDLHLPIKNLRYHMNVGSRRMSSSYTTTTSATGMPTIDSSTKTISIRSLSHSNIFSENERNHYTKSRSLCESPLCIINQIPDEDILKAEVHNDSSYYNNVDESLSDNSEVEEHLNGSIDNNRSDPNLKSKVRLESLTEYVETSDSASEDQCVNSKVPVSSNMNGTKILPLPNLSSRRTSCETHLEFESAASPEVDEILSNIMSWDFQIFELHEKCNVLTQVALRIFQKSNFFKTFKIQEVPFLKYFRALENGYHNIPYHNRIHAADVLHGVYYLTKHKIPGFNSNVAMNLLKENLMTLENDISDDDYGYMGDVMPELELMALYTAAAMHDFDHPGRTNAFLVTTSNPKALLYNDRSVLENHHAAAAWSLLVTNSSMNFLQELDLVDFKRFRFIVIEEILSTDLKKHFDFLTEWNAKVSGQGGGLDYTNESDRLLVGQMMIKVADIAGPSKEWSLHRKWTDRIVEEFYLQGEDEKAFDIPISSYMDRNNPQVPQLQSSFIKHLVSPLYAAYEKAGIMPGEWIDSDVDTISDSEEESSKSSVKKKVAFSVVIDNIQKNHERWLKIISEEEDSCLKNSQQNENIYETNNENDSGNEEPYVTTKLNSLNNILIETANESS